MPQNVALASEAEWHSIREGHVGGSEIASLFYRWEQPDGSIAVTHIYEPAPADARPLGTCCPYRTGYRLYLEKAGHVIPKDFADNERVDAGIYLEPALAAWAMKRWDWKLRKVRRYMKHDLIDGWGSSLDYEAVEPGMPPVEFKNVDGLIYRNEWIEGDDDEIVPPLHINLQLQAQIGVSGADHGWLVVCVGGNTLKRVRVPRHDGVQARIGAAIAAFWTSVREGIDPDETFADLESVRELIAYGEKDKIVDLTGDQTANWLARRYRRWKEHEKVIAEHLDSMKARLGLRLGDATGARLDGLKISWPSIERAEKEIPARIQTAKTYRGGFFCSEIKQPKPKSTKGSKAA